MKVILFRISFALMLTCAVCVPVSVFAQGNSASGLLNILPAITFAITMVIGVLNLYLINRINKSKEEILLIVRREVKEELKDLETRMATQEQLDFFRKETKLLLEKIELKIDNAALRAEKVAFELKDFNK